MERSHGLVITNHFPHISFTESKHLVETFVHGDAGCDVVPAGEVIQCHGTDAHHQNTVKVPLKLLEYIPIEAAGMCHGVIDGLSLFVEHGVGEVVIFIHYQIKFVSTRLSRCCNKGKLAVRVFPFPDPFHEVFGVIGSITFYKIIQPDAEVLIEFYGKHFHVSSYLREVKMQHLELSLPRSRMIRYPKSSEHFRKVLPCIDVVIIAEHGEEQAFAETARTDEKEEMSGLLHCFQIHGFVHKIEGFSPYLSEVRYPIR